MFATVFSRFCIDLFDNDSTWAMVLYHHAVVSQGMEGMV